MKRRPADLALAVAISDELGVDMTPQFVEHAARIAYRLFLHGHVVRELKGGPPPLPPDAKLPPMVGA